MRNPKLANQLLVLPAAFGLLATGANAAELNINGVSDYAASADQVTSVTQFSDVYPTDWAYQALANLVEPTAGRRLPQRHLPWQPGHDPLRSGCPAERLPRPDHRSDDELRRLLKEFETELAILKGRVDGLEARVGELEATQFSTTTKLKGKATFVLGASSGYSNVDSRADAYNASLGATTFNYDLQLTLDTSFTGEDLLRTRLRSGNFGDSSVFASGLTTLDTAFSSDNDLQVDRLFYYFPIGENFSVVAGPVVRQDDMFAIWPSVYPADTVLDVFTYAGAPGAYNLALGSGAGLIWSDNGWTLVLIM